MNGLQVLRRHDVLIIDFQFNVALLVLYDIGTTAHLHACTAVGRRILLVQAQVTLTRHRHAQCPVTEHLDTYRLSHRTLDTLFVDGIINLAHLLQVEFTRQYHYIGKLSIKLQCLRIADVQLRRQMHLLSDLVAVRHDRHIGRNHGTDARFLCRIHNLTHQSHVLVVDNGIYRQVTLHPMLITHLSNLAQVVYGERACRTGTHVQALDSEINGIGTRMNGCSQRLT